LQSLCLQEKSYRSYESLLRRYVRPTLGERNLVEICPLYIQAVYHQLIERGLAARTIRLRKRGHRANHSVF
jgi:hypothetical protein